MGRKACLEMCKLSVYKRYSNGMDEHSHGEIMKKEETEDHTLRNPSGEKYTSKKETNRSCQRGKRKTWGL